MGKHGIFVAKNCKYALIVSFQGYAAVIDSSANCAALHWTDSGGRGEYGCFINLHISDWHIWNTNLCKIIIPIDQDSWNLQEFYKKTLKGLSRKFFRILGNPRNPWKGREFPHHSKILEIFKNFKDYSRTPLISREFCAMLGNPWVFSAIRMNIFRKDTSCFHFIYSFWNILHVIIFFQIPFFEIFFFLQNGLREALLYQ